MLFSNRARISKLALVAQLPTMFSNPEYVEAGGLMSYSANFPDLFRRAGDYVDKILCAGPSPPTSLSSNRPNSTSLSTARPPRRSASKFHRLCWPSPTR
jgi:ABC-type uncharacterized transport system substrate-binding protein